MFKKKSEVDVNQWILNIPMDSHENSAGAATIGRYLICLLHRLWREGDEFSGKRPLGNSGWEYEIYGALVKADVVLGRIDEEGYLEDFGPEAEDQANLLISNAIKSLFKD